MKIGYRTPSVSKSISSRTTGQVTRTVKSTYTPNYGCKGNGYITNPSRACYNKVYHKTTRSCFSRRSSKCGNSVLAIALIPITVISLVITVFYIMNPIIFFSELALYIIGFIVLRNKEKRQLKEERRVEAIIDEIEAKKSNKKIVSVSMSHLDDIEKNL